jgi:iron(III) transport system permease protein
VNDTSSTGGGRLGAPYSGRSNSAWRFLRRHRSAIGRGATALLVAALIGYFVFYPLASILWTSLWHVDATGSGELSLATYREASQDQVLRWAVRNSLMIAAGTTALSGGIGVFLAWIASRTNTPWRRGLASFNLLPFFLSPLVLAIAWRLLAAPNNGLLNQWASQLFGVAEPVFDIYSVPGIIWVLTTFFTPYIYLFALGSLQRMDSRLEEAARVSGANLFATMRTVTLPLSSPAVLAGLVFVFITSAGIIDVPLLLGDPHRVFTLPTVIYQAVNIYPPRYDIAAVVASGLIVLTFCAVAAQQRYLGRRSFVVQSARADATTLDLGWGRYLCLGLNLAYLAISVGLPIGALAIASFSPFWSGSISFADLTLRHYHYVLFEYSLTWSALPNTAVLAVGGASLAVVLATVLAYAFHRLRLPFRSALEAAAALPVTVPGIVIGMGFLVIWVGTPLYGTLWIMLLAFVIHFLGIALRIQAAAIASVGADLEEAGRVSGASWISTTRVILLPLLKTGSASAWLILFIIFVRELSTSVLLWSPGNEVLSVAILIASTQKTLPVVAAFSILQLAILLVSAVLFLRYFGADRVKV